MRIFKPIGEGCELFYDTSKDSIEFFIPNGERLTWQEFKIRYNNL